MNEQEQRISQALAGKSKLGKPGPKTREKSATEIVEALTPRQREAFYDALLSVGWQED